jgi:hypothetical protein
MVHQRLPCLVPLFEVIQCLLAGAVLLAGVNKNVKENTWSGSCTRKERFQPGQPFMSRASCGFLGTTLSVFRMPSKLTYVFGSRVRSMGVVSALRKEKTVDGEVSLGLRDSSREGVTLVVLSEALFNKQVKELASSGTVSVEGYLTCLRESATVHVERSQMISTEVSVLEELKAK